MRLLSGVLLIFLILPNLSFGALIDDQANFFSAHIVEKAERKMNELENKTLPSQSIVIKTRNRVPTGTTLRNYFESEFPRGNFQGIFVFITKVPKKVLVGSSKGTKQKVTRTQLDRVRGLFIDNFKAGNFDLGLRKGVVYLYGLLGSSFHPSRSARKNKTNASSSYPVPLPSGMTKTAPSFPWGKVLLFIGGVLLVGYFIKSMNRRGQRGYSQRQLDSNKEGLGNGSPLGGGGGGSGGGFMRGIFGGLAGAMAGSWLYDKFFGGSSHSSSTGPVSDAQASPGAFEDSPIDGEFGSGEIGDISGDFGSDSDWGSDFGSGDSDFGGDDFDFGGGDDW